MMGARWTEEETQRLKDLYDTGLTPTEVAKEMGRSVGSVDGRLTYIGHKRRVNYKPFTMPELKRIMAMRESGMTWIEISERTGRARTSILDGVKRWC